MLHPEINVQEMNTLSSDERKDLLKWVEKTLRHHLRQKLVLSIIILSSGKVTVREYLEYGFTISVILPVILIIFAVVLLISDLQSELILKDVRKSILLFEQSESAATGSEELMEEQKNETE